MFRSLCDLACHLENLSAAILDLERKSLVWKVRETSITDTIIASFQTLPTYTTVLVDASDESVTSADFEVIFRKAGMDISFLFQAKRTGETAGGTANIPELFHPHRSGRQNTLLRNYCRRNKSVPLYAIYIAQHMITQRSKQSLCGIMTQCAHEIRKNGYRKFSNNDLKLDAHLKESIPFHRLFCEFQRATDLASFAESIGHPSISQSFITEEIPLEYRRKRDEYGCVSARVLVEQTPE